MVEIKVLVEAGLGGGLLDLLLALLPARVQVEAEATGKQSRLLAITQNVSFVNINNILLYMYTL